jgi:FixJ family two-component response regulator
MSADGPVIAVVDDDVSIRRSLDRLLRSAGYRVQTFAADWEFFKSCEEIKPACLVLDVTMPGQNGLDLHEALVATGRAVPVVFITGYGDPRMVERARKAGAMELLSKPFEDSVLLRAVERAIASRDLGRR